MSTKISQLPIYVGLLQTDGYVPVSVLGVTYKIKPNQFVSSGATIVDVYVTGGTYDTSSGVATFTNNYNATFDVSGFTTGLESVLQINNVADIPIIISGDTSQIQLSNDSLTLTNTSGNTSYINTEEISIVGNAGDSINIFKNSINFTNLSNSSQQIFKSNQGQDNSFLPEFQLPAKSATTTYTLATIDDVPPAFTGTGLNDVLAINNSALDKVIILNDSSSNQTNMNIAPTQININQFDGTGVINTNIQGGYIGLYSQTYNDYSLILNRDGILIKNGGSFQKFIGDSTQISGLNNLKYKLPAKTSDGIYTLLTSDMETYTTGLTFNQGTYDLSITRNDGVTLTQNLGILSSDITVTGGSYNINTGIVTFTNNTGGTFNVTGFSSGMTDTFVTGGTYYAPTNTFVYKKNDNSAFSVSGGVLTYSYYDSNLGFRLIPTSTDMNGFGLTKSYNGNLGMLIKNTATAGTSSVAAVTVGGDGDNYSNGTSLSFFGKNYYVTGLRNTGGIYSTNDFNFINTNNSKISFKTGADITTATDKLTISSGGTLNIVTTPSTDNTGSVLGRNSSGNIILIDNNSITSGITTSYVPFSGASKDVNIGNHNYYGNTYFNGFTSVTASTASTITLTINSTPVYLVTGSGGQTIQLPNATTLPNGTVFSFNNNQSSGSINVNNTSGTLVKSVPSGGYLNLELLDNSTATGTWDSHFEIPSNANWSTNTLDWNGSIVNSTWNGNVIQTNRGGTGQSTFTNGQILIGNSGNTLTKATITPGNNINITNGNGSITISSIDTYITGGTYSNGVTTFTNNTGNTFSITGYSTGYTLTSSGISSALGYTPLSAYTDTYVTGGTYSNGTTIFTNNTGGTFNVTGFKINDIFVTGGTYSNGTTIFTNNTGGTFSVTGFSTGTSFTGGTVSGATTFTNGLTATTISATTYQNLPATPFLPLSGGTVSGATNFTSGLTATTISATTYQGLPSYIRRNALNSTNSNIDYCGYALFGSAESSTVWTINRITITSSGTTSTASATNVAWTNRESATYV